MVDAMSIARPAGALQMTRGEPWRPGPREGTAAVEFAVCLPVIMLLIFGAVEASSFIFLKQSLNVAAYEGVREAIRSGSTSAEATTRAVNLLNARNVRDYQITFPAGEAERALRGERIVVQISAPTQTNSPLAGRFVANRQITSCVVMVKE